jgi:hypothetical protein
LVVERRADAVMLIGNPAEPELVVVTEIQLGEDNDKLFSWPQYVVAMRNRWRCHVELLIIAPDPRVVRWARQPIRISHSGSQVVPLVLGTEDFPRLDIDTLAGHPHATVFHALLHCREKKDLPPLQQALSDVHTLPQPDQIGYYEILRRCLAPSFLKLAEVAMSLEHSRFYQELVEKLKAEGEHKALLRTVSRQLGRRLALPGPEALAKMETLSLEALEQLTEDLLEFTSSQDLDTWLASH